MFYLLFSLSTGKKKKRRKKEEEYKCCIVFKSPKHIHVLSLLLSFHWYPIGQRIEYNLSFLWYSVVVHGTGPEYVSELLIIDTPSRQLRSRQIKSIYFNHRQSS